MSDFSVIFGFNMTGKRGVVNADLEDDFFGLGLGFVFAAGAVVGAGGGVGGGAGVSDGLSGGLSVEVVADLAGLCSSASPNTHRFN
jgi:hypothetical protein